MPTFIEIALRSAGINAVDVDRLGVDLELDLARLTAGRPLSTIFDVGGNVGQTALRFAAAFPTAAISTFEPVPSTFEQLVRATRHVARIRAFNVGMGDAPGSAAMHLADDAGSSSLVRPNHARAREHTVDVSIDTLDAFADRHGVGTIDLLKIDVEGYELQVLKGAARRLGDGRIRFVYAECVFSPNDEMPHTSFFDVHRVLDAAGFCFVAYYADAFYLSRGCSQGNVLYALRTALPASAPGRVRNIV